ncbi:MAG: fumarylacetoacetase [Solirubrobacteraceae bacterium]
MGSPPTIDQTHDPARRSWVESANDPDEDFPIQNLPLGVARGQDGRRTLSVAIGDRVLDLGAAARSRLLTGTAAEIAAGAPEQRLNEVLARPAAQLTGLRQQLGWLLDAGAAERPELLSPAAELGFELPCRIGNYTDFYAGIHHAQAASEILGRGGGLGANYRWVPIAYQSRSTSVRASGATVPRPAGQTVAAPGADPTFGPCAMLDFELELGFYVGAPTELGRPVRIGDASDHIAGFCLLNDWSARDIQRWEMAPLGPFLSKSFATTVSPWVITSDALAPFRTHAMTRADGDPQPLDHLHDDGDQAHGGLAIELAVSLQSLAMRSRGEPPTVILRSDARHLYWTPAQMLAHHTSNGCNLVSGDLIGTGTVSGPRDDQLGSLLELTYDGQRPVSLPGDEPRGYLQDGDEVTLTARCVRAGYVSIGFGRCSGTVIPTPEDS